MCNLFFKYFIKQKKNILFLIIIIIFGIVISSISKIENKKTNDEYISFREELLKYYESIIKEIEEKLSQNNLTKEEIEDLGRDREVFSKLLEDEKSKYEANKNSDWKTLYEIYMKFLKPEEINKFIEMNFNTVNIPPITIEITYETLKYLKYNNISSAHHLTLQRTEFEQPRTSEGAKDLDGFSKKTLIGTSHRLWDFFINNLVLIYTFIIVVTFGILFSKLEESQNKTIRFLRTSGASKFKIVSSGLFTGSTLTVLLGLLIPTIFFGMEFLISGSSSFKYPITTYIVKSDYYSLMSFGYNIVPISDVLTKSLILFLLYGIFIFLVTSAISTFVKSSVKSVILSFGLIATLQMFNKWYNPFSYWRVGKIADGSINFLFKTITYSFDKSCKILVIGICILTILLICIAFVQDKITRKYV